MSATRDRQAGVGGLRGGVVAVAWAWAALGLGCTAAPEKPRETAPPPVVAPRVTPPPSPTPPVGRLPTTIRPAPGEVYFEMDTLLGDRFVFKLVNPTRIRQAREILDKKLPKRIVGRVVTSPQPYNKPWHFHLDPATVEFSYLTDPSCDAAIAYIEEHLLEVGDRLLPQGRWCPLSSHLLRELLPAQPAP